MSSAPRPWVVRVPNLPEHADNPIHTDVGARAAGFDAALVAGVTTYVHLTHPLVEAWGTDWLSGGGGEVRFRAPVLADSELHCVPVIDGDHVVVEATSPDGDDRPRATLQAERSVGPPPTVRDGDRLPSRRFVLGEDVAMDYAHRCGDDLVLYRELEIAHPVTWLQIANRVFSTDLVEGSWIHTRSIVRHHDLVPATAAVDVHATVVDRFDRGGRRAVTDIVIEHAGTPAVTIEHEAIIAVA